MGGSGKWGCGGSYAGRRRRARLSPRFGEAARAGVVLLYNNARIWRGNSFDQLTNGFFTLILAEALFICYSIERSRQLLRLFVVSSLPTLP
jgi:hypothetical protein